MEIRIAVQPQIGADYDDLLRVASTCERLGFAGFFMADHLMSMRNPTEALPGPTDVWTTLAGLARETSGIRLGTLMTSANFRHPGVLAIQVAQVDQMSGGRIDFGIGAGWSELEHRAYGVPFPKRRFDVFEEQLAIITGIWSTPLGELFQFSGEHFELVDCPALPKPLQQLPPIMIGGTGERRTPAVAARFADEFNGSYAKPDEVSERFARVRAACEAIGRDPDELVYSIMSSWDVVAGSPQEAIDNLNGLEALGVQRIYLQFPGFTDIDKLEGLAAEVLPHV